MTVTYIRYTPLLMMDMKEVWEAYIVLNHAVHPNCLSLENISYIFGGRNPKIIMWMQMWSAKCHIPFWGNLELDL